MITAVPGPNKLVVKATSCALGSNKLLTRAQASAGYEERT